MVRLSFSWRILVIIVHLYLSNAVLLDVDYMFAPSKLKPWSHHRTEHHLFRPYSVAFVECFRLCADKGLVFDGGWLNVVINDVHSKRGKMPRDL